MFVPRVENDLDLSNIDRFFTREEAKETPTEGSILQEDQEIFEKFTFSQDINIGEGFQ